MPSREYAPAQILALVFELIPLEFLITKSFRKRVLHPLVFSLFHPDPFLSSYHGPRPALSGRPAVTMRSVLSLFRFYP